MEKNEELKKIWDELEDEAYDVTYNNYSYKEANQIIRKHFEAKQKEIEEIKNDVRFIFSLCDMRNPILFHIRKKCQNILTKKE